MNPDEIAKALGADVVIPLDPKNPVADGLRVHRERKAELAMGSVLGQPRCPTCGGRLIQTIVAWYCNTCRTPVDRPVRK